MREKALRTELQSRDFDVELIDDYGGLLAVKKTVRARTSRENMQKIHNEVYGMDYFAQLAWKHPELNLQAPRVFEYGDDFYIRNYVEGQPVVEPEMSLEEAAPRLERFAQFLASIDEIEPPSEPKLIDSSRSESPDINFDEWLRNPLAEKLVNPVQATVAKDLMGKLKPFLRPRVAHGAMSPYKHAFLTGPLDDPTSRIAMIDFENFTPAAIRYYDAAWAYTRLYSLTGSTTIPRHFLNEFTKKCRPVASMEPQLLAALLQRTVEIQHDAVLDAQEGNDYRGRASELLKLVLKADLKELL
jgi:hypothetical protein